MFSELDVTVKFAGTPSFQPPEVALGERSFSATKVRAVVFIDLHTDLHTSMNTNIHNNKHPNKHTSAHTYMHAYIHIYILTCIHAHIHTYIHTSIHENVHTYKHTCTCLHTMIGMHAAIAICAGCINHNSTVSFAVNDGLPWGRLLKRCKRTRRRAALSAAPSVLAFVRRNAALCSFRRWLREIALSDEADSCRCVYSYRL